MQARRTLISSSFFAMVSVSPSPTESTRQNESGRCVGAAGVVRGDVVRLGILGVLPPLWQW